MNKPRATRVYLAGPLFTHAERLWNADLASRLEGRRFQVLLPQDQAREHISANGFDPKALFDLSVRSIEEADVVLAVLDGPDPDSGTCFECGVAWKSGKPVVGLRTDLRAGGDGKAAVNLMLSESCADVIVVSALNDPTFDAVVDSIAETLTAVLARH